MENKDQYDHIVVGGGTAGSVIAARLSEDPAVSVLLVEAGAADPQPAMADPSVWFTLLGTDADWGDQSVVQKFTGRVARLGRGRALGGSSAINATAFLRGSRTDYNRWEMAGAKGWGHLDLLPHFAHGPLRPAPAPRLHPIALAGLRAAAECGYPTAEEYVAAEFGFGPLDLTVAGGRRQSAADAYLRPVLHRPNLTVITGTVVDRLVLNGRTCEGIQFRTAAGPRQASGEVILCAGAIGTPKLLLLSGIGPREHLAAVGVPVAHHLPGVGANLHDHPMTTLLYRSAAAVTPATASGHGEAAGTIYSDPGEAASPDVQILFQDVPVHEGHLTAPGPGEGFSIAMSLVQPFSRGTVRLADGSADSAPLVDPGYYQDERDVRAAVRGLRAAQQIGQADALRGWRAEEVHPGRELDDEGWIAYLRSNVFTYYHFAGTCRIGASDDGVLDSELRVHGIDGLRVADASIMPSPVSANTQATVYAIAERAAALITGR